MGEQVAPPGMQDKGEADLGPEAFGIGRKGMEGIGNSAEQEIE